MACVPRESSDDAIKCLHQSPLNGVAVSKTDLLSFEERLGKLVDSKVCGVLAQIKEETGYLVEITSGGREFAQEGIQDNCIAASIPSVSIPHADFQNAYAQHGNFERQSTLSQAISELQEEEKLEDEEMREEAERIAGAFGNIFGEKPDAFDKHDYRVEDLYWKNGWAQRWARSYWLLHVTNSLICLNALYMAIETEYGASASLYHGPNVWWIFENFFATYFLFELLVRLFAFKAKRDAILDAWFRFDAFLVIISAAECWILGPVMLVINAEDDSDIQSLLGPLRVFRLLRISRAGRIMKVMPELVTIAKGILKSLRGVGSGLVMVTLLDFVFSMAICAVAHGDPNFPPLYYGSLTAVMWTLLLDGTFLDSLGARVHELRNIHTFPAWVTLTLFLIFAAFTGITVMNMLIGILCEVTTEVTAQEKDDYHIGIVKEHILTELKLLDDDGDGMISKDELLGVMKHPKSRAVFESLNVDLPYLLDLQEMIFATTTADTVSLSTIMELMVQCRGDLVITMKQMACGQAFQRWVISKEVNRVEHNINKLLLALQPQPFSCGLNQDGISIAAPAPHQSIAQSKFTANSVW